MFRVERFDITGNFFSTWDTFEEADAEYERQLLCAINMPEEPAVVGLMVILRHN